jgi:hypothetical protein
VAKVSIFGYSLDSDNKMYYFLVVLTVLTVLAIKNLVRTRVGRAFIAIRDRDIAAEVMGVNITAYKVMAFTISSFFAGIAGAMYSYTMGYIHPEHFTSLALIGTLDYLDNIALDHLNGGFGGEVFGPHRVRDEVVQLYIRDVVGSVTRPVKELKGFKRITLKPDEKRTVKFTLGPKELSFTNKEMKYTVESGTIKVMVGKSSDGIQHTGSFEVK